MNNTLVNPMAAPAPVRFFIQKDLKYGYRAVVEVKNQKLFRLTLVDPKGIETKFDGVFFSQETAFKFASHIARSEVRWSLIWAYKRDHDDYCSSDFITAEYVRDLEMLSENLKYAEVVS